MIKPQTLKGFRDFLPQEARKRQYVINTFKSVFEYFDFEPLETPALEYEEILLGKYGDEADKLMYRFTDNGGRKVAMRYDQTVPLARVVAQYQDKLPMPFKRYQIQNVWRAENTQKGRFREFIQCDADIIGTKSTLADAQIIMVAMSTLKVLGFDKFKVSINDRNVFKNLSKQTIISVDKLKKIGEEGVIKELTQRDNLSFDQAKAILEEIRNTQETDLISDIQKNLEYVRPSGRIIDISRILKVFNMDNVEVIFDPTLARGLNYYTGLIFEIEIEGYSAGSVCGGGRYDDLIGMFADKQIPAVGFAFGFDRIMEAMDQFNLIPKTPPSTKVLVTIFSSDLKNNSIEIASKLREKDINTELYLDENAKLDKQLKYADQKQIPYAVVIGPDEAKNDMVTLKNLKTRTQETLSFNDAIDKLV